MFNIPVKLEGVNKRRRSVGLFHILASFFLAANASLAIKYLDFKYIWPLTPIYLMAAGSIVYGFLHNKLDVDHKFNRLLRALQLLTFLTLAVFQLNSVDVFRSISLFLWAGICLILLFTERFIFHQPVVMISDEGITTPAGISLNSINWNALESVVLRHDYITISLNNNKFLQFEILNLLTGTEIDRINSFCRDHLDKAKSQIDRE